MARTIDEKVVEMRFDNQNFESNVAQSMSTLDKLKAALNFSGMESAFSNISSAADKVNLGGLSGALDEVSGKFSALEAVAVGALMNIGSKVADLALDTVKGLTIDQVTAGFDKYEKKTEAVQMIMNATGMEIEDVNTQLERLNWYTDETSYDFAEMVSSIGKFTAAGIDLETAVTSMQGIANWAGISGANKQEANRAMYNISQALSGGFMRLVDWKSIENANMATKEFKEMAIQAALARGTLQEAIDEEGNVVAGVLTDAGFEEVNYKNLSSTLTEGKWLTNEVLTDVLDMYGKFTTELSAVYDDLSETSDITTSQIIKLTNQWRDGTIDMEQAMLMTGKSAEELEEIFKRLGAEEYELGRRSFAAAQEAKTFKDAIEATKDAVSTGFMNTFELLFGNYEEAKVLWTDLANELWDIFAGPISDMNDVLLGWKGLEVGGREDFIQSIKNIYHALRSIVDPITEAWEAIFPPINSVRLGEIVDGFQQFTSKLILSDEKVEILRSSFEKIFSAIEFVTSGVKTLIGAFRDSFFSENQGGFMKGFFIALEDGAGAIVNLVEGFKIISEYYVSAMDGSDKLAEHISSINKIMHPIMYGLVDIFYKLKDSLAVVGEYFGKLLSFNDWFVDYGEAGEGLAGIINVIAYRIRDTLSAVKDLIQIWTGIDLSEPFEKAWDTIRSFVRQIEDLQADGVFDNIKEKFFGLFDTFEERFGSVLSWFKPLGEAFASIWDDFFDGIKLLIGEKGEGVAGFFESIETGLDSINEFIKNSPTLGTFVEGFKGIIKDISEFLAKFLSFKDAIQTFRDAGGGLSGIGAVIAEKLRDIFDLVADIIQRITGFDIHGIADKVSSAFGTIITVVTNAIGHVKDFFSMFKKDSTKDVEEFGDNVEKKLTPLQSLLEGIKKLFGGIWQALQKLKPVFDVIVTKLGDFLGEIGESIGNAFKNADIGSILDIISKGFGIAVKAGFAKVLFSLSGTIKDVGDAFGAIGDVFESIQKKIDPNQLLKIAAAVGIITLSVITLSGVDSNGLKTALSALAAVLTELIAAMAIGSELSSGTTKKTASTMSTQLIAISVSLLIAASALKKIGSLDWDQIQNGLRGMGIALAQMVVAVIAIDKFGGNNAGKGATMIAISLSMLIVAQALKKVGLLEWDQIGKGLVGMGLALAELVAAVVIIDKFGSSHGGSGATMLALTISMNIVALALKSIGEMDWDQIVKGLVGMGAALAEVTIAMIVLDKFGNGGVLAAVGFAAMAAALLLLTAPIKIFASMSLEEIGKSLLMLLGTFVVIGGAGALLGSIALEIIAFAASLAVMALALTLLIPSLEILGNMSLAEIGKSLLAIAGVFVVIGGFGALFGTVSPLILGFAAALAVMAAALLLLTPSLIALGNMSLEEIGKSLLMLAGTFAVVGVAGLLLGPISPMIIALSVAIALLGVAVLSIGTGLTLFATGLSMLAATGSAGIAVLIAAITSIINLIPLLITKVGEGIMAIIKMVGENAVTIAEVVVKLVGAILDAAQTLIPKIVETVVTIIDEVLKTLAEHSGSIIDSVAAIMLALLNGLAEYLPDFIQAGIDIVLSLIEGLGQGIIDNAERAREAFTNLFKSIVEAILLFLGVDKEEAEEFVNIAGDMLNGLISGITKFAMDVFLAIGEFMTNLVDKVKEKLPEFIDRGKEIIDNIKEGFNSKVEEATEALKTVVNKIIEGATKVVDKAKELGKAIINKIKGGTEEPEVKQEAQNVGKTVGKNVEEGLVESVPGIKKTAKKVMKQTVDAMKDAAQISSPSEVTKDQVGKFLGLGIGEGLFESIPDVEKVASSFMDKIVDGMTTTEVANLAKEAGLDLGGNFESGLESFIDGSYNTGSLLSNASIDGLLSGEDGMYNAGTILADAGIDGILTGEDGMYDSTSLLAESGVDGLLSGEYNMGEAGTLLGTTGADSLLSEYTTYYDAGEYDASGAIAGVESYAAGGSNSWKTQDAAIGVVSNMADTITSNSDIMETAGITLAESVQEGYLGANWNEFQKAAAAPFEEALSNLSGYASDPWFALNDEDYRKLETPLSRVSTVTVIGADDFYGTNSTYDYRMNTYGAEEFALQAAQAAQASAENGARWNEALNGNGMRWNEALTDEVRGLRDDMATYTDKVTNLQVVMDTGTVAGELTPSIDKNMGTRWEMSRRGV